MNEQPQGWRRLATLLVPVALCATGTGVAVAGGSPNTNKTQTFNIEAGEAAYRLNDFSTQSGLQLLFGFESMKGIPITPVHGQMKPFDALNRMIAGTNIRYSFINKRTVTLTVGDESQPPSSMQLVARRAGAAARDRRAPDAQIEEVTILSEYKSSIASTGSPILTLNRNEIEALGVATVQGIIRTLPQVFGGGPTEDTRIGFEAGTNTSFGNGINLRGLGASATLVLINGRRLALGGSEGLFVDISNLPAGAVERVDILPDSSSTYYGADAVGGVVNFVMREKFDGAQSEVRYGVATRGGLNDNYVSQIVGGSTSRSHGLLAFDFYSRDNVPAASRELARSDLTAFGGSNFDSLLSNPGNIVFGQSTWAIPTGQDGTSLDPSQLQPGTSNRQNQYEGADLLPSQQRWSLFGTGRYEWSDRLTFFSDVLVGERDVRHIATGAPLTFRVPETNPFHINPTGSPGPVSVSYNFLDDLGSRVSDIRVRGNDIGAGLEWELSPRWNLTATVGHTTEEIRATVDNVVDFAALNAALAQTDPSQAFNPFGDGSHTNPAVLETIRTRASFNTRSGLRFAGASATGSVFELPGGSVTLALGGETREQSLETTTRASLTGIPVHVDLHRSIQSAFAELKIPVIGPANRRDWAESLELSLSERYEHYSDFGKTLAARLGLSWSPFRGLTLHGTYSESFRPPGLMDLDESKNAYSFTQQADPTTGGVSNVLFWVGKNRDLNEETARSWTAGFEYEPTWLRSSALALTYFNSRFSDRLSQPTLGADLLTNSSYQALIERDPSAEYRAEVCSRAPTGRSLEDCFSTPIVAIADLRVRNDAAVHTQGFDVLARSSLDTGLGKLTFGMNSTYILEYAEARTSQLPLVNRVSTPNYPINLRIRGSMGWHRNGMDISGHVNYLNSYLDTVSVPRRHVGSWTTLDLRAAYSLQAAGHDVLGETMLSLGIENVFDEDPPFLNNAIGIGYDQENGDLTGRMVSFTVRKKW